MRVYTRQVAAPAAPQTRQVGLPGGAFGQAQAQQTGQAAQALGGVAQAMGKVAANMKARNDDAWLSSAAAQYREFADSYLYDPEKGVLNTQMDAAQGITKQAKNDFDTKFKDIVGTAPDPRVGALLESKLADFRATQLRTSARHEGGQLVKWETASAEEDANLAFATWQRDWSTSPEEYETTFNRTVVPTLQHVGKVTGKPVEALIQEKKAQGQANMIYQNIANGALGKARDLSERWDKTLKPEDKLKITATMRKKDVDMQSDNISNGLFDQVQQETLTPADAREQIRKIEDADIRNKARGKYRSLEADYRVQQRQVQEDLTVEYTDNLDSLEGSLADQQDYVDNLPENTPAERKAKKAANRRYGMYAKAEGASMLSDAGSFERISENIAAGVITTPNQITGSEDGAALTAADRKMFTGMLKSKQSLSSIRLQFQQTLGSKYSADRWREFLPYAYERITAANKGDDPVFTQRVVDYYLLEGETKNMFLPGYGRDKIFGKAQDAKDWLPDIPKEAEAAFVQKFNADTSVRDSWVKKYKGDAELAMRAAYKQARESQTLSAAERAKRTQGAQ